MAFSPAGQASKPNYVVGSTAPSLTSAALPKLMLPLIFENPTPGGSSVIRQEAEADNIKELLAANVSGVNLQVDSRGELGPGPVTGSRTFHPTVKEEVDEALQKASSVTTKTTANKQPATASGDAQSGHSDNQSEHPSPPPSPPSIPPVASGSGDTADSSLGSRANSPKKPSQAWASAVTRIQKIRRSPERSERRSGCTSTNGGWSVAQGSLRHCRRSLRQSL